MARPWCAEFRTYCDFGVCRAVALCGSGTTYQLQETSDGWEVVGTRGTAWIA